MKIWDNSAFAFQHSKFLVEKLGYLGCWAYNYKQWGYDGIKFSTRFRLLLVAYVITYGSKEQIHISTLLFDSMIATTWLTFFATIFDWYLLFKHCSPFLLASYCAFKSILGASRSASRNLSILGASRSASRNLNIKYW